MIYNIEDTHPVPDIIHPYDPDSLGDSGASLVIDNGSFNCRVGWSMDTKPRLIFKNIIAKQRGKKDYEAQIGNDISNIEVVRWLLKTQFDRDVVTQFDAQELIFDYIFSHLGINTQGSVDHPIILTETLCNPNYSRQLMSELLFECYHIPSVAYGVDCLYSFHHNNPGERGRTGFIISCGYHTTHLVPLLDGRPDFPNVRRINVGGSHIASFNHRLLQLHYPAHFAALTLSRAEVLVHKHAYLVEDYFESLNDWTDPDFYEKHVHKIQLPYNSLSSSTTSVEAQKERRLQQIKRLQEMNAKRREERLAVDEEKLRQLTSVQELLEDDEEDAFQHALEELGIPSARALQASIEKLNSRIQRKMLAENKDEEPMQQGPKAKRWCDYPNIKNQGEFDTWLNSVRVRRQELLDARAQRRQRRADMARRRTLASQQRMKIISELAADKKKEDNFGQNDDDWKVYKTINREGGDTDSEEEQEKLQELEQILRENDPTFVKETEIQNKSDHSFNLAEYYQIHLGVERIRVPELIFQPSMMGIEQAGIAEAMDFILQKYPRELQDVLTQNVFLTGGSACLSGFKPRLERELLAMRPFQSEFQVFCADDPILDAWKGAQHWAAINNGNGNGVITRADYDEKGGEYLKEHAASNKYFTTNMSASKFDKI